MIVQNLDTHHRKLMALSGVMAALFLPQAAFASMLPPLPSITSSNPNNPVSLVPTSTLFMTPPPAPQGSAQNPQLQDVIGKAFNRDDLNALYGAGAFNSCETASRVPSHFEKNYSNFVQPCMEELRSRQAITFDERFQANPTSHGIAESPLGGRLQWSQISTGAQQRLLQRAVNDLAQKNKTLADIMQGRISFDFGLGSFFSSSPSAVEVQPQRPRYVVDFVPVEPNKNHIDRKKLVASIGYVPEQSLSKKTNWWSGKPQRNKRVLRETFEPNPALVKEAEIPHLMPSDESDSALTSLKNMSQMVGLRQLPFTKMNLRAERRSVEGKNQVALRATESQELFFAELPDIRKAATSSLVWGYKLPWKKHALNVRIDEGTAEKTTSYSYKIDDSNKTDFSFDHKTRSVSAGFVISF
ncbi:MAG: hypothetical protein RIR26_94 [Pseudomonadota bacterium]